MKLFEAIIKIWIIIESARLHVLGYKLYAIGAVAYALHRLRLWQGIFVRGRSILSMLENAILSLI